MDLRTLKHRCRVLHLVALAAVYIFNVHGLLWVNCPCLSLLTCPLAFICRRQNGENKPLTVPKDIDLHLEKAPVNVIDALGKISSSPYTTVALCKHKLRTGTPYICVY